MRKNTQISQSSLSKSSAKPPYLKNTLKEFKNIEKADDFDVEEYSIKKMPQYEAVAIKLGLMSKKDKSCKPQPKNQEPKGIKACSSKTLSDFSRHQSKKLQKQNSNFFQNRQIHDVAPQKQSQYRKLENPYTSLHNNFMAQSSQNCIQNHSELQNIYRKYLSESQIQASHQKQIRQEQETMSTDLMKTQKSISRLQVKLNLLINKYRQQG